MTGPYVIGCDVGSQGTNCALYAADGTLVASSYQTYDLSFPFPGAAEQDADAWPAAIVTGVRELLEEVPEGPSAVKGLSFGSQLDGMVVCGADGRPLRPAMIWMDRRAEAQAAAVAERMPPETFYRHVGANLDSSHAIFKALWVRDEEPEVWANASTLMSPGTYALQSVAGPVAVDYSNASSFALLDPRTRAWSPEVLAAVDVPASMLPEVVGATEPISTITEAFAQASGLDPSTIVAVGCGDEMAATLGAGVFEPGEVCDVVGTAEPVCAASSEPREDPTMLVECHPHADPDAWLLENPGFVSGGNLRWWRDQFAPIERGAEAEGLGDAYDLLSREAERVPPGRGGARVPAVHAGGDGAGVERRRARRVLRAHARALARAHDARDLGGERVRPARHRRGDGERGSGRPQAHDRGRRREGPAVAADQGGRHRSAGARPHQRRDDRDGRSDPGRGWGRAPRERRRCGRAFVSYRPEQHEPVGSNRSAYDEAYRRYRQVYGRSPPSSRPAEPTRARSSARAPSR